MNFTYTTMSRRGFPRLALAGALAFSIAGCDTNKIVEVEDPAALTPEEVNNAAAIPALVNGAFRQFLGGYSGFGLDDAFLSASAVITDEMYYGDTFTTREAADKRTTQPVVLGNISDAAFTRLMQARFNAKRAFAVVEEFETTETATTDLANKAQLRTIEGYAYVTLSEGWCGAVPFSNLPDTGPIDPTQIEEGVPLSWAQMNDTAIIRFDEALTYNPANRLTAMGRARALLNNARYAEAAAAVAAIPTEYVFHLEHSVNLSAENNPIASLQQNGRYGVANLEGGLTATGTALRSDLNTHPTTAPSAEGIAFRGLRDPRVPWQARPGNGRCFSSSIFCWWNNNYFTLEADVPLTSGVEARLIEAEAALQAGDPVTMMARLNTLRANVATILPRLYPNQKQVFPDPSVGSPSLAPLTDPGIGLATPAEQFEARRALLFTERALWLYNTGHRLGDLRRLVRQYGFTTSQVFPSGPHFRGGNYGPDVSYPVPFNEQNNTKYNPAACVTSAA